MVTVRTSATFTLKSFWTAWLDLRLVGVGVHFEAQRVLGSFLVTPFSVTIGRRSLHKCS